MNHKLLEVPRWRGPLILAMKHAIVANFDAEDWQNIGYLTGQHDYIRKHRRLLRSLRFRDKDYSHHVLEVLEFFINNDKQAFFQVIEHPKIYPHLERDQTRKLTELGYHAVHVPAVLPTVSASNVVQRALEDADNLLATSGAPSTIDRLHTAMHGYLKSICKDSEIALPDNATLTQAYKALRTQHSTLKSLGEHNGEVGKILTSFASVLDALNTLRNHGSIAHPNEDIVGPSEGELVVNAVRTVFHYLSQKIHS